MPKMKTHKGAQKRFHITGGGKIMRVKVGKSHFRRRKKTSTKGLYDETIPLHPADAKRIKRVLPYR
ncbi:MAG: 50S ribosomal protein L35 [Dehalococcoidia bacterium]|jgi:large subunit ribosomal protein L35|nr:50S ribosomal protein L35 [Dehalococcoidia bacterium]MDD5494656.1 50S ribosomal protein L35 [Dehalococcoidia bacterium]